MPFDLNYSLIYSLKYFLLNIYKIWLQTDSYTNPYSKEFFFLLILKIYLFLFKDYGNVLFLLEEFNTNSRFTGKFDEQQRIIIFFSVAIFTSK